MEQTAFTFKSTPPSTVSLADEIADRNTRVTAIVDLFQARPQIWIPVEVLAQVGGFCSWRTRVSDARKRVQGSIEWNGNVRQSAYRFTPAEVSGSL